MKMNKALQTITLFFGGIFLLNTSVHASAVCSSKDLAKFKELYIELQKQLNYEGKDAYLDAKGVVQLKAHPKDAPYPGKVFEDALFGEYQNSLRKVGRLYQLSKFEGDDSFKSNPTLLKFMEAIEDKGSASTEFVSKTKIDDVIDALEIASKKKFANTNDKKFALTAGDKYLLKKLLTHAQDRICSVKKYEDTGKGTAHFRADYLQQVKNAPLNRLVNSLKTAQIGKDSKIDLKASTLDLVDEDVAVKSAVAEHVTNLSNWVKNNKDRCLTAIRSRPFMNSIQSNIQGCNYLQFIDSLNQESFNKLEAVMHFINANERFLNNAQAKAETSLDELKLEGYIGKAFDDLGTQIRCTQIASNTSKDKKVFVRNLPYDEATNKFDTSSIICKSRGKDLSADACKKQYDLVSDDLGRGLEIKPKKGIPAGLSFSIKDAGNCNDIDLVSDQEKECGKKKQEGFIFTWDSEKKECTKVNADKDPKKTCETQKKKGFIFEWDDKDKTCDEMPSEHFKQVREAQKKDGIIFKWDDESTPPCIETPVLKESKASCESKKKAGFRFKWDEEKSTCNESIADTKASCEAKKKDGIHFTWDENKSTCGESIADTKASCEAKKKDGIRFSWDDDKSTCSESVADTKASCETKKKDGIRFTWDDDKSTCSESVADTKASCEAKKKSGIRFTWDEDKSTCSESVADTKASCEAKKKSGIRFTWDENKSTCNELVADTKASCEAKKKDGLTFKWDEEKSECTESTLDLKASCEAQEEDGYSFKWNAEKKSCDKNQVLTLEEACEKQEKEGYSFIWNYSAGKCEEVSIINEADCERQVKEGVSFIWNYSAGKCEETPILSAEKKCTDKKEEGFTFTWNKEKNECVKAENKKEDKKDDKKTEEDLVKKCEEKNQNWIKKSNDGVRDVKYMWDGKVCKDLKPDTGKRGIEDNDEPGQVDPPSAPKVAPQRFTPINIPTRQMYILPGMP